MNSFLVARRSALIDGGDSELVAHRTALVDGGDGELVTRRREAGMVNSSLVDQLILNSNRRLATVELACLVDYWLLVLIFAREIMQLICLLIIACIGTCAAEFICAKSC